MKLFSYDNIVSVFKKLYNNILTLAATTQKTVDEIYENLDTIDEELTESVKSVDVGTTITGDAGTAASVENSGTTKDVVLNFTIPRGDKGDPGENGKMLYGTCSTEESTAEKEIVCADAISLYAGLSVFVLFSRENTAGAPTLDVNSLGTKNIYINGATASSSNPFLWAANTYIQFTYDGAYWIPVSAPPVYDSDSKVLTMF